MSKSLISWKFQTVKEKCQNPLYHGAEGVEKKTRALQRVNDILIVLLLYYLVRIKLIVEICLNIFFRKL